MTQRLFVLIGIASLMVSTYQPSVNGQAPTKPANAASRHSKEDPR